MRTRIRLLFFLILLVLSHIAISQKSVYLDGKWEKCKKSKAHYVAIVTSLEDGLYQIEVNHYPEKTPWSKGKYHSTLPLLARAEGEIKWYFPDGKEMQKSFYVNGTQEGESIIYYANGSVEELQHYLNGKKEGQWLFFGENGDTLRISHYYAGEIHGKRILYNRGHVLFEEAHFTHGKFDGPYKLNFPHGSRDKEGQYTEDKMVGTWRFYHTNGQLASIEEYADGKIKSAQIFDDAGKPQELEITLEELIALPTFKGGNDSLYKYLRERLVYPKEAKENNIQGKVYVEMLIDPSGKLISTKLSKKELGYGLDAEALRVANMLVEWEKFSNHNRNYPIKINLPFNFTLK